jgi:hypothetical protein
MIKSKVLELINGRIILNTMGNGTKIKWAARGFLHHKMGNYYE